MGGQHPVRCVHPKIVALLGRPEAAAARLELATCAQLKVSPSQFRGRATVTTYVYDDVGRVVRTATSSSWTGEDRALMLAWQEFQDGLCKGCGHPKATAWHQHSGDSFDLVGEFICWACTATQEPDKDGVRQPVKYPVVEDTRDYSLFPLKGSPEPFLPD